DVPALLGLEVQGDRALVRGLREVARSHLLLVEGAVAARIAALVVLRGMLDLDDVGSQKPQLIRRERPGQHMRDVDDLDALVWPHGILPRWLRYCTVQSRASADRAPAPTRPAARTTSRADSHERDHRAEPGGYQPGRVAAARAAPA